MNYEEIIQCNEDLRKLDDEYVISIEESHLLVHEVPYVNKEREICLGVLVSKLDSAGNKLTKPQDHSCYFRAEHYPCDKDGVELRGIVANNSNMKLFGDFEVQFHLSCKPTEDYKDYYNKMTNYIKIIENQAQAIDDSVTAKDTSSRKARFSKTDSPFVYDDTNSSRAGIFEIDQKLQGMNIVIIGLGGTGSYLLDFVAKTPVKNIHIFDDDDLKNHNAFRCPGAVPEKVLQQGNKKVSYFYDLYSEIHKGIHKHEFKVTKKNLEEFIEQSSAKPDFVFVCIDQNVVKKDIIGVLINHSIPFIDTAIGIIPSDKKKLLASVQTTMICDNKNDHFVDRMTFHDNHDDDGIYNTNIQIVEMNALNAALAIIRWKKEVGFYETTGQKEHYSVYNSMHNKIINAETK